MRINDHDHGHFYQQHIEHNDNYLHGLLRKLLVHMGCGDQSLVAHYRRLRNLFGRHDRFQHVIDDKRHHHDYDANGYINQQHVNHDHNHDCAESGL
jgi:hypothetical protein